MPTNGSFKEYERLSRTVMVEDTFQGGMQFTNNPLPTGFSKLLVNFDLKDQGATLVPRGGLKDIKSVAIDEDDTLVIHHTSNIYVSDNDEQDATVYKYILLCKQTDGQYDFSTTVLVVNVDGTFITATLSKTYTAKAYKQLTSAHGLDFVAGFSDNTGIYASVDSNTYIPVYDTTNSKTLMAHLKPKFNADKTAITFTMDALTAYDVKASQSINSGYNMLKDDPYSFENTENATGSLVLEGLVPRDGAGDIKMSTNVGEEVRYYLHYTYPSTHANKEYVVLWKIKDVNSSEDAKVLRRIRGDEAITYDPGDDIYLDYKVAYKQYTMVVEVYDKADVTAHTYVSDEDDYKKLRPLKSITVSSYLNLTSNAGTNANLTMKTYDLKTCTGMCSWQQRMVLWGVQGATTTLWVSQPNKPEYIPYPNNVEVFQERIMKCVPYLTNLLVFTETKLYSLTLSTDQNGNTYYVTKCMQERLIMTEEDASTICVVKNMVYFKSGSYFYMVVPFAASRYTGSGDLQLAPVSTPITPLLDSFKESITGIIDDTYNLRNLLGLKSDTETYAIDCLGYSNVLDGNTMRNIYRLRLTITKDSEDDEDGVVTYEYLNLSLNYDTVLRAWTTYIFQSGTSKLVPYELTVTDSVTLINNVDNTLYITQFEETSPSDESTTDGTRIFFNHQLIDTGYRAHYKDWKKRFREIQFTVNSLEQKTLKFHTSFTLDDDVRREFYKYKIQHITDKTDVNYGMIYVERYIADPLEVADSTAYIDTDGWTLDFTRTPDISLAKVRYKISGKGYTGKIAILSTNQIRYELIGVNWVYRKMNAR